MIRGAFIQAAVAFAVAPATPSPKPAPSPTGDLCEKNFALPYDHPLEIRMRVLDGPDFSLMKYRGKPVWINIFATWCSPCNVEQATVVNLARSFYGLGLRTIGMNYKEPDNTVRGYRTKYNIPYPIAMDENGGFVRALEQGDGPGSLSFPAHLFITAYGNLLCYKRGDLSLAEMAAKIEALIAYAPVVPASGLYPTPRPLRA